MHQLASHAREIQQALHVTREKFADYVVHIAAGAECFARSGYHYDPHILLVAQDSESVRQLAIDFERNRVQSFGPVQRDRCYAVVRLLIEKGRWLLHLCGAVAWFLFNPLQRFSPAQAEPLSSTLEQCLPPIVS